MRPCGGACGTLGITQTALQLLPGTLVNERNPLIGPPGDVPCLLGGLMQAGTGFLLACIDGLCRRLLGRQHLVHGGLGVVRVKRVVWIICHERTVPCGSGSLPALL
jgi:hypothetical protein